jgi:Zn-dependent metalloprotease
VRCLRTSLVSGVLLTVIVASGLGMTAYGVSSPAPTSGPGKAARIAAEQSRADSTESALGLNAGEKLVVKDVIADPDGTTNTRYHRTFDGLRVIGGDFVSHRDKSGRIKGVSWNGSPEVAVASTTPKLSLTSAKAAGNRKAALVQETTGATKGELVVYSTGASTRATPKLAYDVLTVGTQTDQTPSRVHTIVDASSGATLSSWDEIENGTGNGIYSGSVGIGTTAGPPWSMRDAVGNDTTDLSGVVDNTGTVAGRTFTDDDDLWGNGAVTDRASAAVDAHYGAGKTFDYFKNVQGRNGIWGTGVGARSRVHFGDSYANAFWDGTQMTYGDGAGNTRPVVQLDVVGHEMTHGVTENTAGLVGIGEAGGLNEATSDIFGTSIEWYAANAVDTPDYLIGELINVTGDGTPLRYMDRPSRDGVSPDCWSPTLGELDVHTSSGPLNHWFYLASEGSGAKVVNGVSYNSPTCNALAVTPIGREKAARIWYRTLTTYLTSGNTYAAAREGAIQSAKDLYGATSAECVGVAASFSAIAVPAGGATCSTTPPPLTGTNLLRNPGFESGAVLWSATHVGPGQVPVINDMPGWGAARSGTWAAWLCGRSAESYDSISQLVTIPAGRRATLSYYVIIGTAEDTTTVAYDTLTVRAGSTVLQTLSNLDAGNSYQLKTVDLSAYAGRTISLTFAGAEDAYAGTSFVLDDLAVTTSPIDFSGDGKTDLVAVKTNGELYLYRGNGLGGFTGAGAKIGGGWSQFSKVFSPGDFTGDGKADLVAAKPSGELYLYRGNGLGGFTGAGARIGVGWGVFSKVFSPGDFTGDGKADLVAVKPSGELYLYRGNGLGGFTGAGARIGVGWGVFSKVFSPGDFTGDGKADLVAVKPRGELYLYRGNGVGGFAGAGAKIGGGWSAFTIVF